MSDHLEEDVEMLNNGSVEDNCDNSMQIDSTGKRLCTERNSSDSLDNVSLSQVSLNNATDKSIDVPSGIENFKPTKLEIIEESEFIWNLDNFNEFGDSPVFNIGGTAWYINYNLIERTPNNKIVALHLAVDKKVAVQEKGDDWSVCAEMILGIYNPNFMESLKELGESVASKVGEAPSSPSPALTSRSLSSITSSFSSKSNVKLQSPKGPLTNGQSQSSFHRFVPDEPDWGFSQFCSVNAFKTGIPEYNVGPLASPTGETRIIAKIRVVKDTTGVLWHNFSNYDSKAVTGYVGLLNQGATCYMNSFVQSIFLTNEFRSAVYRIPTENDSPTSSIPLALQRIFYKLQTNVSPPSTTEMTKSFGWDTAESFMQHDVQEFSRVLMDDLENKMKGSDVEGTVERLFRGKLKNVLKCTQVEYESVREESFYDLQLTIKGIKDLKESFERYVAAEMLCGDNQYRTDDFGLQDAKKFVTFEHFPPVLHVHLERYAFDMMAEATVKIHDRFEFPVEIDLDPYLSETSPDRSTPQTYWLHSVLVHAGDGHGGHYFVYIRHPSKPDCWYKFDDTKVTPCTQHEAVDENFGGYEALSSEENQELYRSTGVKPYRYKKFTSAYLLVYIRKCDLDTVLSPVKESDVPEYLVERIKSDDITEARKRHERQQQYLNTNVTVLTEESMQNYSGSDICDPDSDEFTYKCKREATVEEVCEGIIRSMENIPDCDGYECYPLVSRRNKTIRPDAKLTDQDTRTVGSYTTRLNTTAISFFVRLTHSEAYSTGDLWRQPLTADKVLMFFKWYDRVNDKLIILGSMPVDREQSVGSLTPILMAKLEEIGIKYSGDENGLTFYEEFKPSKIVPVDSEKTFKEADLRHGDIVLLEPKTSNDEGSNVRSVVDYFDDLISWRIVDIKPLVPNQSQTVFENLKISIKWNLKQLSQFIADKLEVDSEKIRLSFTSDSNCVSSGIEFISDENSNANDNKPIQFLKSNNEGTVKDFLIGTSPIDIVTIKYEITKDPISQVENQVRYFVESNGSCNSIESLPIVIYLTPYVSTVTDLIKEITDVDPKRFRLLEVSNGKIRRTFASGSVNESLTPIDPEKCSLYLEEIGEELSNKTISCFTFEKHQAEPFGIPFKIDIRPDETVKSLKTRIAQRIGVTSPESLSLFLSSVIRGRKLEDPNEILANVPGGKFYDEDQLAVMTLDPRKQRSNSGFDGAIRFRK